MKRDCQRLVKTARKFLTRYKFVMSRDGACGLCACGSRDFIRVMKIGRLLHLLGSRVAFPDRNDYYKNWPETDPDLYHAVVEYRGYVLDISRRQFQPHARMPFVQKIETVRRQWIKVSFRNPLP